jgi:hypothetical protein
MLVVSESEHVAALAGAALRPVVTTRPSKIAIIFLMFRPILKKTQLS